MRLLAAFAFVSMSTLLAGPAFAEPSKQQFAAAQNLYDEKSYERALAQFEKLAAETASPNAELYVARCLRELGRFPQAYEQMRVALRDASAKADQDPRYERTRDAAAAELATLEAKIAKVVIAVADPPSGLAVTLNGAPLPADKLGVPFATAPGEGVIVARAPGKKDVETRVALRAGESRTVALSFHDVEIATKPNAPAPLPVAAAKTGGGARFAGYFVVGVGVAGFATFAGAGIVSNNKYAALKQDCADGSCPTRASQIQSGKSFDTIADVGLGVGIAGVLVGTAMIAFGGPKEAAPSGSAWSLTPGPGPLGLGLRWRILKPSKHVMTAASRTGPYPGSSRSRSTGHVGREKWLVVGRHRGERHELGGGRVKPLAVRDRDDVTPRRAVGVRRPRPARHPVHVDLRARDGDFPDRCRTVRTRSGGAG